MERWKIELEIEKINDGFVITQKTRHAGIKIPSDLDGENYKISVDTASEALSEITTRLTQQAQDLNNA